MSQSDHLPPSHSFVGEVHSTPYESDHVQVRPLVKCNHCGYMWFHEPGSGRLRGFCQQCNSFVCGRPGCREQGCITEDQRLENCEAGLGFWSTYKPIIVSVTSEPPAG